MGWLANATDPGDSVRPQVARANGEKQLGVSRRPAEDPDTYRRVARLGGHDGEGRPNPAGEAGRAPSFSESRTSLHDDFDPTSAGRK